MKKCLLIACLCLCWAGSSLAQPVVEPKWPDITREAKPWARWWWEGSAVRPVDIAASLDRYSKVNIGGLEITPIYGVKGYEDRFLDFLSPRWMEMLQYTLTEAKKRGVGIDLANASGWPFGGPWVGPEDACKNIAYKYYTLKAGQRLEEKVAAIQTPMSRSIGTRIAPEDLKEPLSANGNLQEIAFEQVRFAKPLPLVALMAFDQNGRSVDLSSRVDAQGTLNWVAPEGEWGLYALFMGWHGKMVERAAPGGEGNVIDHFSAGAIDRYLAYFDKAARGYDLSYLRYYFNDSYEVDDAQGESNWTPDLFEQFRTRRGYDLRLHLPALLSRDEPGKNARVLHDFRQTINDLLIDEYSKHWQSWAAAQGKGIRNQAHGSPANILDVYAVSDVPEIEGNDLLRIKSAPSASHVTGKKLTSSESATWLGEHFHSTLGDVKGAMDLFLLGGVNHTFYHGANFSPEDAPFPGWLFYAAVHFTHHNPFWNDFGKFNQYIARCQSFLQSGKPDNDILLYFPASDVWSTPGNAMLEHFDGLNARFNGTSTRISADSLLKRGYAWDYVSDKMILNNLSFRDGAIHTGGTTYQVIYVPECRYMPSETVDRLMELAAQGATVVVHRALPAQVAGFHNWEARTEAYAAQKAQLRFVRTALGVQRAPLGKGAFLLGNDIELLMKEARVRRESLYDSGLQCIRRRLDNSTVYFIKNTSTETIRTWVPLASGFQSAALFDPMTETKGYAYVRGNADKQVYLQLLPGETVLVEAYRQARTGARFDYYESAGAPVALQGSWKLSFASGGPQLPAATQLSRLGSWADAYPFFSGMGVYSLSFALPQGNAQAWMLDLGSVGESASVWVNGTNVGTVFRAPYKTVVPASLLKAQNTLEVRVSNSMLNRVIGMDRNNENYRIFYNTNFPARVGTNRGTDGLFNASKLEPRPSGLMGPVSLSPLRKVVPQD